MRGAGISPATRRQVVVMLRDGKGATDVARALGLSTAAVAMIKHREGLSNKRGAVKAKVLELLPAGGSAHDIAAEAGCSSRYVALVRGEVGAVATAPPSWPGNGRAMHPAEPEDAPDSPAIAVLAQPFVDDGPITAEAIDLDGGRLTIEPGSRGRALLTIHERQHGAAVVRVDRAQLDRVIASLTAARDALPEVTP